VDAEPGQLDCRARLAASARVCGEIYSMGGSWISEMNNNARLSLEEFFQLGDLRRIELENIFDVLLELGAVGGIDIEAGFFRFAD
jgi:hypothetical protein